VRDRGNFSTFARLIRPLKDSAADSSTADDAPLGSTRTHSLLRQDSAAADPVEAPESTHPLVRHSRPLTLLGVLIDFGVISVLVVDGAATGAWAQFDQTTYLIDPRCATVAPANAAPAAQQPTTSSAGL
jgi:hypothetical protein